jgi:hypothetical protein
MGRCKDFGVGFLFSCEINWHVLFDVKSWLDLKIVDKIKSTKNSSNLDYFSRKNFIWSAFANFFGVKFPVDFLSTTIHANQFLIIKFYITGWLKKSFSTLQTNKNELGLHVIRFLPWRPSSFFCLKCDEVFF